VQDAAARSLVRLVNAGDHASSALYNALSLDPPVN